MLSQPNGTSGPRVAVEDLLLLLGSFSVAAYMWLGPLSVSGGVDFALLHSLNREYFVSSVREGRWPLWDPYVGLGRPFAADIETGTFYPPNLLQLALSLRAAYLILTTAHLFLAAFATRRLARLLGASRVCSVGAALAFATSGALMARLQMGEVPIVFAFCYLPAILYVAARLQDEPGTRRLGVLALLIALQVLAGHPQAVFVGGLAAASFVLGRRIGVPSLSRLRSTLLDTGLLAAAYAWAFGLAAIQLLPFVELAGQGNRTKPSIAFASAYNMPWYALTSLFVPPSRVAVFEWEDVLFSGVLTSIAGLSALALLRGRNARGLLTMSLVGGFVALGDQTLLFPLMYHLLPGLGYLRIPSRAALLLTLGVTLAASLLLSLERRARATVLYGLVTVLGLLAALHEYRVATAPAGPWLALQLVLILGAGALLVLHGERHHLPAKGATAALVLMALFHMLDVTRGVWSTKGYYGFYYPQALRARPGEEEVRAALRQEGLLEKGLPPPRIAMPNNVVRPNSGRVGGWSAYMGYGSLTLERVWLYLHERLGIEPPEFQNTEPSTLIRGYLPFPYDTMNLVLGYDSKANALVGRSNPDPRAFVVGRVRSVAGWRETLAEVRSGEDPHREAIVEASFGMPPLEGLPGAVGEARIRTFLPEEISVEVSSRAEGLLVLAEAWYPGWHAYVNGTERPCVPVNLWMRGVRVPEGQSLVQFTFRSSELGRGGLVSALSALLLAGVWLSSGRSSGEAQRP